MKNINIGIDDSEIEVINKAKELEGKSWHDILLGWAKAKAEEVEIKDG